MIFAPAFELLRCRLLRRALQAKVRQAVNALIARLEPPRDSRGLQLLRGWSDGNPEEEVHDVFVRGPRAGRAGGV